MPYLAGFFNTTQIHCSIQSNHQPDLIPLSANDTLELRRDSRICAGGEWEQEREAGGMGVPPGVCDLERETDGEDRGYWPTRDAYLRGQRTAVDVKWRGRGCVYGNIWLSFKSTWRMPLENSAASGFKDTHYATLIKASPELDSLVHQNL
ncbi:hypothetical protein B0H14DRAFT_2592007 [Mycena olivaceomarginata]|nr:hypothetical protein B0H14DRAFT_2592007 [Mycena olivaceomarginata]